MKEKLSKLAAALAGIITGLAVVLVLNELLKGALALLILDEKVKFIFSGISLHAIFNFSDSISFIVYILIYISPLFFSIIFIEVTSGIIKKTYNDFVRSVLVFFQVVNIGFIIFSIILGIISILFNGTPVTDWWILLSYSGYSYSQKLLFMLFILLIVLGYINFSAKRMRSQIPMIQKELK